MNDQARDLLVGKVEEELAKVKEQLLVLIEKTQPISPSNAIGRVSRMDAIGNKMVNEQALKNLQSRKEQLGTVLASANSADFGLCMFCQSPIRVERLLAMPESTLCMRCAERM